MLNVEEVVCPELRLAMCHVKEALRLALHTIVVCRSLGGHRPIEPRCSRSEQFDLSYMRTDELEVEQELERGIREFSDVFESNLSRSGRAHIVLSFYTTKPRKQSLWNIIVGTDEKVIFEQWRIPIAVQALHRYSNAEDNLREEASLQASAAQQLSQVLQYVLRACTKVDHLPPEPDSQASYRFEISSAAVDGKSLHGRGGGGASVLGRASAAAIKNIPYIK
eukprot:TRINITY_DN39192_c0_g1_i1.p1 TRINITY_DN39192_c0_g1~~TRINITY_DN39192_c0_g1_i1.p1  ORF type:complete len:222 (+),score=45.06 TRINITY_DN39192_c0_g1_i1:112-777(+)